MTVNVIHICLHYISKEHVGAKNAFLIRTFDLWATKTQVNLAQHEVNRWGGGVQMEFFPASRFGPNIASGIKMNLLKYHEGDVQLTKRKHVGYVLLLQLILLLLLLKLLLIQHYYCFYVSYYYHHYYDTNTIKG